MDKKFLLIFALFFGIYSPTFAGENNDLRTLFTSNKAVICGINIRNFNAQDENGNEIIDNNEASGNFLNAIDRLDEIKELGINTLHVLPITPVGRLKALGTAGSVYAISSFDKINPQLVDKYAEMSDVEQARKFVEECHNRGIRVVIDLPSCGAYDLFLTNPELFIKNSKQCSIVPTDWTDVRLFNTGNAIKLNQDLMDAHKKFVDLVLQIGADGIRADVATIKPYGFWKELIKYTRDKDPEFMFLAEASDSWREPPSKYAVFTPYDKLMSAGFDGYYGSFFNLKEWDAEGFINHIKFNQKLLSSYKDSKSVILSFTTHDELSPILLHGENFSIMISWLEGTLPYNPYVIDGFSTGDTYIYPWENAKAPVSDTDDDYYFVHRGKLDIFNFSRKPGGDNLEILKNLKDAYKFRQDNINLITRGSFIPLKTNNKKVFAFARNLNNETIIVIGNLDFENKQENVVIHTPQVRKKTEFDIIKGENNLKCGYKKIYTDLDSGEIKVLKKKG